MAPAIAEFVAEIDLDNCVLQLPSAASDVRFSSNSAVDAVPKAINLFLWTL